VRPDGFAKAVLSLCLLCAALLVAQRSSAWRSANTPESQVGRYAVRRLESVPIARNPLLLVDTAEGRVWLMKNYLDRYPYLIPFEMLPSIEPFIARTEEETRPSTLELLMDTATGAGSPMMRAWATDQLGLGDYEPAVVVPVLLEALRDEDANVVAMAAQALGRKPDPRNVPALREVLSHPDARVVELARQAIAELE
jgi:HEAT repeat protein